MDHQHAGSTNSIRNLPQGKLNNIRKMFESGQAAEGETNLPSSPLSKPSMASSPPPKPSMASQPPKPVPRSKPKITDLPAKPKVYCVPVHKSQLEDGAPTATGANSFADELNKIYESPKKTNGPKSYNAQNPEIGTSREKPAVPPLKPVIKKTSFRKATPQAIEKKEEITSELEVRLRKRQNAHAFRNHPNRKSEADVTLTVDNGSESGSPKRFSDSFEKSPVIKSDQKVQFNFKPVSDVTKQTNSNSEDHGSNDETYLNYDIIAKTKLFGISKQTKSLAEEHSSSDETYLNYDIIAKSKLFGTSKQTKSVADQNSNNETGTKSDISPKAKVFRTPKTTITMADDQNSNNETFAKIDISAKAKLFDVKKQAPDRPALPKFKPGHIRQRSAGSSVEYTKINKLKSGSEQQPTIETINDAQPEGPKKPPRTHAHDEYLKVKLQKNAVIVTPNALYESIDNEEPSDDGLQVVSIKDRISQLHQRPASQDDTVMRKTGPTRPPPPRQRPFSEFKPSSTTHSAQEGLFFPKNAPEIPDSSPGEIYEFTPAFKKYGTLPRRPTGSKKNRPSSSGENDSSGSPKKRSNSAKKFPMRKSLSSECLYQGNGVCERFYHDPNEFVGRDETFEAYVDTEGYAVPNKFIKRKVREKMSWDPESSHDRPLSEALKAKFDGIRRRIAPEKPPPVPNNSAEFNKRCRIQVRDKINQAFSILRRYVQKRKDVDALDDADFDTTSTDSDSFVDVAEIQKRKIYASTIRKKTYQSVKKSKEFLSNIYPQLFEYAVLVGLRPVPAGQGYEAYIIHKFPEIVDSNVSVPLFCFPDALDYKPEKNMKSETYSFVLTNFDGGRVYGYCKRILPSDSRLPEVICIISPVEASNMYNALLYEIEVRRMINIELAKELLAASFGRPLPKPGHDVQIRCLDEIGEMDTVHLKRPADGRLDNVNYDCLLTYLGTDKLVKVFSSLLLERRVILYSKSLNCLTQVIKAVVALLYPFHWQHIYIPILPISMLDVCCSPTPYLIGILSSHVNTVLDMPLDEVMIVDLDKKNILTSVGDESTILPKKITKALKMAINMCKIDIEAERSQALMISEAFLRVFVETVGHYGEFINTQQDGHKVFLKENFITKRESQGLQQFLEWFTETQMFEVFITNHLEKRDWGTCDVFMTRVMEHNRDGGAGALQFERPGIGQKVKNIGKAIKSKLG